MQNWFMLRCSRMCAFFVEGWQRKSSFPTGAEILHGLFPSLLFHLSSSSASLAQTFVMFLHISFPFFEWRLSSSGQVQLNSLSLDKLIFHLDEQTCGFWGFLLLKCGSKAVILPTELQRLAFPYMHHHVLLRCQCIHGCKKEEKKRWHEMNGRLRWCPRSRRLWLG